MSKATGTREKTREAHALLVARGENPSARQILRTIDGGSLSTITDELAQIHTREKAREAFAMLSARGEAPSAGQIAEIIGGGNLATISDELSKLSAGAGSATPAIAQPQTALSPGKESHHDQVPVMHELVVMRERMEQLTNTLGAMAAELKELRVGAADQLRVAYERFEAVQRLALQQVDLARQEARDAKSRLAAVTLDSETREDAMRGKVQQLRDENQRLLGRIEELQKLN